MARAAPPARTIRCTAESFVFMLPVSVSSLGNTLIIRHEATWDQVRVFRLARAAAMGPPGRLESVRRGRSALRVAGVWSHTVDRDRVTVEIEPFQTLNNL